ncbi:MAG TPA: hypothetical protein VMM38_10410 [Aridibacter sp.]|nr:hypothetical protein [Aridibacter sp.]
MYRNFVISMLVLAVGSTAVLAQEKTAVNSPYAKRILLGRHFFSLQWISWDHYGRVNVTEKNDLLHIKGEQKGRDNDDYLTIDGVVTEVNRYDFKFRGKIVTKVSHNNEGEPCVREGDMIFKITGKRKYWRLQEMDSPCEGIVDYVDIYFRK